MKSGADQTDDYLAEWRKDMIDTRDGDPQTLAEAEAARLVEEYDQAKVKALIENGGRA